MLSSQASKAKLQGNKPPPSSSSTNRSISSSGTVVPGPLVSLQSPVDSTPPVKTPLNAHAAKAFLCSAGYLDSKAEICTPGLCSNLLLTIAARSDASQNLSTLIKCVSLILPEALALTNSTNAQLTSISNKIDTLLAIDKEPIISPPPAFAELGAKLDKVTQEVQKVTETWQTVPSRSRARSPPPPNTPLNPVHATQMGPTHAEITRNRRIQSQGCYIMVEPTSTAIKESLDGLNARTLVKKAEIAWDAAWESVKGTDAAKELELTAKPCITFKVALRLARGGIRYELGDHNQAALLSDAHVASAFEKGFGGGSCRGQGATILLQCAPIQFNPEDTTTISHFEGENRLNKGDVLSITWCKPPHKHKPEQTMAEGNSTIIGYSSERLTKSPCDAFAARTTAIKLPSVMSAVTMECPTLRAECEIFNKHCPENKSLLFGPPRPYDPRQCPIYYQPPSFGEMFPDGGYTSLAANQNRIYRERSPRRTSWTAREQPCKEHGNGEDWDTPNVQTAPCIFTHAMGANAVFIRPPNPSTSVPASPPRGLSYVQVSSPPRSYTPSQPVPVTPPWDISILAVPATLTHDSITISSLTVFHLNVNKSNEAQTAFAHDLDARNTTVVANQEPYLDHLGGSRMPPGWTPLYPSGHHKKDQPRSRSFLAVNPHLSSNVWEQVPCPSPDVTAMKIQTTVSPVLICNIYNPCDANTSLPHASSLLRAHRGLAIILGDFNRHHPDWDESRNTHLFTTTALNLAQPLLDLVSENSLDMVLPKDIPTLQSTSSKNYMRPDNIFVSTPLAESLPPSLTLPQAKGPPRITKPNFKKTDWPKFRQALKDGLDNLPGLRRIHSQDEIDKRVGELMETIHKVVRASTPNLRLCAWSKRWWSISVSLELGAHRKLFRMLATRSYRERFDQEDQVHEEYRMQRNHYSQAIKDAKKRHWEDFLEGLDEETMWKAASYLSSEPTDGGRACVPNLKYTLDDGAQGIMSDNSTKSQVLMDTFFPPSPPPPTNAGKARYPTPVLDVPELQTHHIRQAVHAMKPHKAPGPDGLPACVYIQSIDVLEKHLLPIFRASLRLGIYPSEWRKSRTIVLCKPGKPDYGLAKAYCPIALLNVISKILSACIANRLNELVEKHSWLPNHHYGGRQGRTTMDALHLLTKTVKDAWASKKVALALFLDIKGAFPHANPLRLAENMHELGVPAVYVNWMLAKLEGRTTCLAFDDYTLDMMPIENGIDQGCPLSVVFYLLYNSPLVQIPRPPDHELCIAYIDDITFVVWGDTFEENHCVLVDMMTRRKGALDWSRTHSSTFELDKTACVDFAPPTTSKKLERPPLRINNQVINPTHSHTLLGVIIEQTLNWKEQCDKALAKGQKWAGQLNHLARMSYGTSAATARRLYLSIAVPWFTYTVDIWFSPVITIPGKRRTGSVGLVTRLARIQSTTARAILGAMHSTPVTSLDAHLDLLPMHLLMNEACQRAAIRLAAVSEEHPLYKAVSKCAIGRKRHPLPLQNILRFANIHPSDYESWPLGCRPLPSIPPEHFPDRTVAIELARADTAHIQVFTDGSAGEAGTAAAAILFETGGPEIRAGVRLGDKRVHSVLDTEVAGILLATHLVAHKQEDTIVKDVMIYTDSQAAITCIHGHTKGASRELLKETRKAIRRIKKGSGGTEVNLRWCPGHTGVLGNETADVEAARAARGTHYAPHLIPHFLADYRPPTNPTTHKLAMKDKSRELAETHWTSSDAGTKFATRFPNLHPRHFLGHSKGLTRSRATLLFRLITRHVQLKQHLHRLQLVNSPKCEHCGTESETVSHYLLRCPHYAIHCHTLITSNGPDFLQLSFLLHVPRALDPLFNFIKATGRFSDLVT
ncbi:hypothetical protein RSAG8_08633, partial [Rhizoctonia solani AG-8 WAC10335]